MTLKPRHRPSHPGLALSGDFDTPAAVIASNLTDDDKLEILKQWREDLKNAPADCDPGLVEDVDESMAYLIGKGAD